MKPEGSLLYVQKIQRTQISCKPATTDISLTGGRRKETEEENNTRRRKVRRIRRVITESRNDCRLIQFVQLNGSCRPILAAADALYFSVNKVTN